MKKASKLLWLLASLAMAVIVLAGCSQDVEDNSIDIPDGYMVLYYGYASGVDGIHFHAGDMGGGEIEVLKIFLSNGKKTKGAKLLFDFSNDPAWDQSDMYDWAPNGDFTSRINDGLYKHSGAASYSYGGGFASPSFTDYDTVGFIIKNTDEETLGDVRLIPTTGSTEGKVVLFKSLLPDYVDGGDSGNEDNNEEWMLPYVVDNYTAIYQEIPAGTTQVHFHVGAWDDGGSVQIEKVFVSNNNDGSMNTDIIDFTNADIYDTEDFWWFNDIPDLVDNGKYILENDGYKYGGGFAYKSIGDYKYLGFSINSDSGLGDSRVEFKSETDSLKSIRLSEILEAGINLKNWTTVYKEAAIDADAIHFNAEDGYLEIQKIFYNNTMTETGATILFDFTANPVFSLADEGGNIYWQGIIDAATHTGPFIYDAEEKGSYAGGFGNNVTGTGGYIGFVIKTNTNDTSGLGSIRAKIGDDFYYFASVWTEKPIARVLISSDEE